MSKRIGPPEKEIPESYQEKKRIQKPQARTSAKKEGEKNLQKKLKRYTHLKAEDLAERLK